MSMEEYEARLAREIAERKAQYGALRTLAEALTVEGFTLLPAKVDPDNASSWDLFYSREKLRHEDGRELWIHRGHPGNRLEISGYLSPEMWEQRPYRATNVTITVSDNRPPAAITREIERRLLPGYTKLYGECKARLDASNAYAIATDKTIRAVADAFGAEVREPSYGPKPFRASSVTWHRTNGAYGSAKASGDTVSLDLCNLTLAQAVAIANLLNCREG